MSKIYNIELSDEEGEGQGVEAPTLPTAQPIPQQQQQQQQLQPLQPPPPTGPPPPTINVQLHPFLARLLQATAAGFGGGGDFDQDRGRFEDVEEDRETERDYEERGIYGDNDNDRFRVVVEVTIQYVVFGYFEPIISQ